MHRMQAHRPALLYNMSRYTGWPYMHFSSNSFIAECITSGHQHELAAGLARLSERQVGPLARGVAVGSSRQVVLHARQLRRMLLCQGHLRTHHAHDVFECLLAALHEDAP